MMPTNRQHVALVTIASGERYVRYAREMLASAEAWFFADVDIERSFHLLEGRHGWPDASMHRYHVLTENADRFEGITHLFMIDADMRFVAPVGGEILGPLVGTQHPGYVGRRGPYDTDPRSAAHVGSDEGVEYYCGGFLGGELDAFLSLAGSIRDAVDRDAAHGLVALWHDESHVNRYLASHPPSLVLSPSYCYPEDDEAYRRDVWTMEYPPRIVARRKGRSVGWSHRIADAVVRAKRRIGRRRPGR